ncbi:MAG: AAA family ATPase [Anaerovoracaceae bacterium]
MGKILVIENHKGGVGKTNLVSNLSAALALMGKTVLMVDLDDLCSLTTSFGYDPKSFEFSSASVLQNPASVIKSIYETDIKGLSLMPCSTLMSWVVMELTTKKDKMTRLQKALFKVKDLFDYIIIDCSPALVYSTINALVAADYLLIPTETKTQSHLTLPLCLETYNTIRSTTNPNLKFLGVVATLFCCQAREDKEILTELGNTYDLLGVIKRSASASKGVKDGEPCVVGQRKTVVAREYMRIADVLMQKMEG